MLILPAARFAFSTTALFKWAERRFSVSDRLKLLLRAYSCSFSPPICFIVSFSHLSLLIDSIYIEWIVRFY